MSKLAKFVMDNVERGSCTCGKCIDAPEVSKQPEGHTADLIFFKVTLVGTVDKDEFVNLIKEHKGEFADLDPLDGNEWSDIILWCLVG